ncbi:DUF4230 domain-containing protein [Listeria monocytogenes]|nr:DUF4230 domain-containing protein [Listeria monocytogenes]
MKRTLIAFTAGAIIVGSLTFTLGGNRAESPEASTPAPIVLHEETIVNALTESAQLVTLTGKAEKTERYSDAKWYGKQEAMVNVRGTFKLGVNTKDIEISTVGNVVKVTLPQPKLITLSLPYDNMTITNDSGLWRKDVDEPQLKALYSEAKSEIKADIANDKRAQDKAEASAEKTVGSIILKINGVEFVKFEN